MADDKLPIGPELKRLRRRAGLSSRSVARFLAIPTTSYEKYEDRSRKPFLPLDMVAKLVMGLSGYGVDADDVWALANPEDVKFFVRAWHRTREERSSIVAGDATIRALRRQVSELEGQVREKDRLNALLLARLGRASEHDDVQVPQELERRRAFALNVRRRRKSKGWRQKDLGDQVGAHDTTVSSWEISGSIPNQKTVQKLAKVFDCRIEELFTIHDYRSRLETRE